MQKHKNAILMLVALVLFLYLGIVTIYPKILKLSFNIEKFEQKVHESTTLTTSIDSIDFKMTPALNLIITINNWNSKYVYEVEQDCFEAAVIQLTTNPFAPITKKFKIKDLYLNQVVFNNQLLPEGVNKLAFLSQSFSPMSFGVKKVTIVPGPVTVKHFTIKYIAPNFYNEKIRKEVKYTEAEVREFLKQRGFNNVIIR